MSDKWDEIAKDLLWLAKHERGLYEADIAQALRDARNKALDEAADLARQQAELFRNEAHDQKQWGNREMHKRALMIASFFDSHAAAVAALKTPETPHTQIPHPQEQTV